MKEIIKESDINELSVNEQLEFYKKQFTYQHCERCNNELAWGWIEYDGDLYCNDCFNIVTEEDKREAQKEIDEYEKKIDEYEKKIKKLKEDYDL